MRFIGKELKMKVSKLKDMRRGWFIGNFNPSLAKTNDCEVAVKSYRIDDYETSHFHKVATEYTVIIKGQVKMFNQIFSEGDIVVCEPGDVTDFTALTDAVNVVVKIPGVNDDKYICVKDELTDD